MSTADIYKLALSFIDDIGGASARVLLHHFGDPEEVFKAKKRELQLIPGIGRFRASRIVESDALFRAERELMWIEKSDVQMLWFQDQEYPRRLAECHDAPIMLFQKGRVDLNARRVIAIVGTRNATDYGRYITEKLVSELAPYHPLVVSGLALGIDACAHSASLRNGLETLAVFGTGLDKIYPSLNRHLASDILNQGAWLSENPSKTKPDRDRFPSRNRIVAGMSDATIVIEAAKSGGALITAEMAMGYDRDVFAVPGRLDDVYSEGCNEVIRNQKAHLIMNGDQLAAVLGWKRDASNSVVQTAMFVELEAGDHPFIELLKSEGPMQVDTLAIRLKKPISEVNARLTLLEIKGAVRQSGARIYSSLI